MRAFTYMKPDNGCRSGSGDHGLRSRSAFSGGRYDALRPDETECRDALQRHRCQFAHGAERLRYLWLERAGVRRAGADERRRRRPVASWPTIPRFRNRCGARRRHSFATWQASAATSSSAPDAPIFAAAEPFACNKRKPGSGCAARTA